MIKFIHWEEDDAETGEGDTLVLDHHDHKKTLLAVYNTITKETISGERYIEIWCTGRRTSSADDIEGHVEQLCRKAVEAPLLSGMTSFNDAFSEVFGNV